jgi:hypothetical protein
MEYWEGAGSWYYIFQLVCYGFLALGCIVAFVDMFKNNKKDK